MSVDEKLWELIAHCKTLTFHNDGGYWIVQGRDSDGREMADGRGRGAAVAIADAYRGLVGR